SLALAPAAPETGALQSNPNGVASSFPRMNSTLLWRFAGEYSLSSFARFWLPMAVQINTKNMKTYTKSIILAALTLALAGSARGADETVAGKWKGQFDSQIGLQKYTYEFKVDGTNLTGKAIGEREMGTNEVVITEGTVSTNGISFVEPLKFGDNEL